ncbi:MAG TPA: toll/interleukin-1 receptor domain-containing protein [Rhizomicrobium sp.]|nr:toll/interleukin-1 receptor domain-containing protein [Rhizomicrobium sp.]
MSYSHRDADFGRRLHRRLESYSLPRRLVGRATGQGTVPRRIAPIFRDRDEFPAANDLSAEVRAALQASRSLVVVCSRDAALSKWVLREVALFRALHPHGDLCRQRDGEGQTRLTPPSPARPRQPCDT